MPYIIDKLYHYTRHHHRQYTITVNITESGPVPAFDSKCCLQRSNDSS